MVSQSGISTLFEILLSIFVNLDWLRHQPGIKRLVAIALSASAFQEDVDRAYDLGATCYMQKCGES
jgi:hypothetical protein